MIARSFNVPASWAWLGLAGLAILPFAELTAFFWVASRVGLPLALIALVATSFIGVSLLRRQGTAAFSRLMRALQGGEPTGAARESMMVALGGVLMIIPGFVTDVIGFALILPSLFKQWQEGSPVTPRTRPGATSADPKVIDLDKDEWKPVD
ncbi:membrane protein FxsA [Labrys miyagiensis]|uniref:Membrane protein FxsA n=1 Tax=Labrys miyagiensis TaxID=346912 RepID=A0ABQ6CHF1_9HYPH|nr:FxsA family protein [Labrys miyagiensis]GLS18280.1 membrane protein FxsA [Labrys miyagiensis]